MALPSHVHGRVTRKVQRVSQHSYTRPSSASVALDFQPLRQYTVQRTLQAPRSLVPADITVLQRSMGNQAVLQMLGDGPRRGSQSVQPNSAVGPAADKYEQEADRVAQQAVNTRAPLQRSLGTRQARADGILMRQPLVQRSSADGFEVDGDFERHLQQSRGGGRALPRALRADFEPKFGANFAGVKVHTGAHADRLSRSIQAKAFTSGQDLFFRQGAYNPGRQEGKELIAHELTHVMQQNGTTVRAKHAPQRATVARTAKRSGGRDVLRSHDNQAAAPSPTFLKMPSRGGSKNAPIQRKFGFEIEVPILFTTRKTFNDVYTSGLPNPKATPARKLTGVPCDAAFHRGETDVYNIPNAEAHVNVDHFGPLDPLYKKELNQYATQKGLNDNQKAGLQLYGADRLFRHKASIMEVVTDAWDESAMSRTQAIAKFTAIKDWVDDRFDDIKNSQQAQLGTNYYLGSDAPYSDLFQPRLGYFHSTYGVKLSKVPELFNKTTAQRGNLKSYAKRNVPQQEHADNLMQTYKSIGKARDALDGIKKVWPRTGAGWFKNGYIKTKGTKGWTPGTEASFLGFLTLLDNYLLMFKAGRGGNLAKQMVGMHYYKSDLFDVALALPSEIIDTLNTNKVLRNQVIDAIGESVGFAADDTLGGPLANWTLKSYLKQVFTGSKGVEGQDVDNKDIRDPLLAGSINPYSKKLGPNKIGPRGNKEMGVVMENRHLEYLNPNYGARQTASEQWRQQESTATSPPKVGNDTRTAKQKARYESFPAREKGPARRPINEWVDIMTNIYDMLVEVNQ